MANTSDVGAVASVDEPASYENTRDWELSVIVYNSNDTSDKTSLAHVNISISGLPPEKELVFALYKLDSKNGNPYDVWRRQGSPVFPSDNLLKELRKHQV